APGTPDDPEPPDDPDWVDPDDPDGLPDDTERSGCPDQQPMPTPASVRPACVRAPAPWGSASAGRRGPLPGRPRLGRATSSAPLLGIRMVRMIRNVRM